MNLTEYARCDGLKLAELVRRGEVRVDEVLACASAAMDAINPLINAVIDRLDGTAQLATAAKSGPFYGAPFLIKDIALHAKGVPCDMASRFVQGGFVPQEDSELMARFRRSGVVSVGRSNAPEFGLNASTEPVLYGATRNPWNLGHSAGGSSGGAAAAVASGIVPLAHANDAAGSIRIPASACGVVGLKPTRGRVSFGPDHCEPLHGLGIELVISRSVRDTAAMLDAVEGPALGERFVIARPERPYLQEIATPPRRLRIAFSAEVDSYGPSSVNDECARALEVVAKRCVELGHHVEAGKPRYDVEAFHRANMMFAASFCASGIAATAQMLKRRPSPENLEATIWANYQYGMALKAVDLEFADAMMNQVCRSVAPFFEQFDVLLTPTIATPPVKIGVLNANDPSLDAEGWYRKILQVIPYTALYNMTGQPAISLPLAQSGAGLPIGIQAVGRYGDEATILKLAAQLEQAMPWGGRVPPVHVSRPATRNPEELRNLVD